MNTNVDNYLVVGCMRCKYGGTPQCKVVNFVTELKLLRQLVLETELCEEVKWGVPVYTLNGKNVLSINALKASANLSFFKGALLQDTANLLEQQGNVQAGRILKFKNTNEVQENQEQIKNYIQQAIAIEKSGAKVALNKNPEPIPEALLLVFEQDPAFETAFYKLTLGKQRGYILHFSQPKKIATQLERIHKMKEHIFKGIGFNAIYKLKKEE